METTHSMAYNYVLNQYLMGRFTDANLVTLVTRGVITEEERLEIMTYKTW